MVDNTGNQQEHSPIEQFFIGIHDTIENIRSVIEKASRGGFNSLDELNSALEQAGSNSKLISDTLKIYNIIPTILEISKLISQPFLVQMQMLVNGEFRNRLVTPDNYLQFLLNGTVNREYVEDQLGKYGYSREDVHSLISSLRKPIPPDVLMRLFSRGKIDRETLDDDFRRMGYSSVDVGLFLQDRAIIPNVNDLIRMAIRDVFSPDTVNSFRLFDEYPTKLNEFITPQGLSEEWGKRYWGAHWELPSVQMAYEMFHRRVINQTELELLMKAKDIAPGWRDKLVKISYNPLTRVDIRRMYAEGILNANDVYNAYLDVGYEPVNAKRLTDFTVKLANAKNEDQPDENKQLTREVLIRAYILGVYDKNTTLNGLINIGFLKADAELLIKLADTQRLIDSKVEIKDNTKDRLKSLAITAFEANVMSEIDFISILRLVGYDDKQIQSIVKLSELNSTIRVKSKIVSELTEGFLNGTIYEAELNKILNINGFTQPEIVKIKNELTALSVIKNKRPSKAEIDRFYKGGLITDSEYLEELSLMGYNEYYSQLFLDTINKD